MTPAVLLMVLSTAAGIFVPGWIQKATTNRSAGLETPAEKPAPEVGLTGCLEQGTTPGTFILRDARQKPDDLSEKSGDYLVAQVAPLDLQLGQHVSHSVRLFGVVKENDQVPSGDSEATEPKLPTLGAKELRMASETCAADEGDDESDDLEGDSSSGSGGRIGFSDLGSAGMAGGFPQMTGGYMGQSSLKSDLAPDLFAGISGGYRIGLVSGLASSQNISTAAGSPEIAIDPSDPTQTSGWSGPSSGSIAPTGQIASFNGAPTSAGPTIAVNSAATNLGVNLSAGNVLAPVNGPAPIPNPEPASLVLLGSGLASLAVAARRRRARRSQTAV